MGHISEHPCAVIDFCTNPSPTSFNVQLKNWPESIGSQFTQIAMPDVRIILLYMTDNVLHHSEHFRIIIIIDITLK